MLVEVIKAITNNEKLLRKRIIELALEQLNKPYIYEKGKPDIKHGPDSFDCAGFAWYVYHEILGIDIYQDGIKIPSTTTRILTSSFGTITYFEDNSLDKDFSLIHDGDILLFHTQSPEDNEPKVGSKYPGHAAIYLGNNKFIHASSKLGYVSIADFEEKKSLTKQLVASKNIVKDFIKD